MVTSLYVITYESKKHTYLEDEGESDSELRA